MKRKYAICETCGKKVTYTECLESTTPPENPKCTALLGWLTVSRWQGFEDIDHHEFCSFTCLQKWVEEQVPKIPKPFLEAFKDKPD